MRGFFSGAVFFFLTLTVAAQSPPVKPIAKPAVEEPPLYYDISGDESTAKFDARFRIAFDKRLRWEYLETSLQDVVADLTKRLEIPVELDVRGLDEVGVNQETPITFQHADMPARGAVRHLLEAHGLTFYPRHGRVIITSPTAVKPTTRLYPVADLVAKERKLSGAAFRDVESLVELLRQFIQFDPWWEGAGPGPGPEAVNDNAISLRGPYDGHLELERFLLALRRARHMLRDNPERFPDEGIDVLGTDAIRKKLEPVESFEFKGSLRDLAAELERKLKTPVRLNIRDLDEVGVTPDVEISGRYEKTALKYALRLLLEPHGLTYRIAPDGVEITNPDAAGKPQNFQFRIFSLPRGYDDRTSQTVNSATWHGSWDQDSGSLETADGLQFLVVRNSEEIMEEVAAMLAAMRKIDNWERRLPDAAKPEYETRLFEIAWTKPREVAAGDKAETRVDTVEPSAEQIAQLMGFLRRNVAPESWAGKEVRMDAWRNKLLIRQKGAVLKEIDEWLRELGARPRSPFGSDFGG